MIACEAPLPRLGLPGGKRVEPAGMFYIGLRGRPRGSTSRRDLPPPEEARRGIYVHRGRFRSDAADALDRTHALGPSGQFALARNKDGSLRRGGDARDATEWNELLRQVRETLVRLQALLRSGVVAPSPFRHRGKTACDGCPSREICRFDPWLQPFRALG